MAAVRDEMKWHMGIDMGCDPSQDPQLVLLLEMQFAEWLLNGGGEWLRSIPQINQELDQ